jgi:hypothetical protein
MVDALTMARIAAALPPRVVSTKEEIDARRAERRAKKAAEPKKQKRLSYREMYAASEGKASAVQKPVQFVRQFLDENFGTMKRREALDALVRAGVNMSTARRQYQKYKTRKEKKETDSATQTEC